MPGEGGGVYIKRCRAYAKSVEASLDTIEMSQHAVQDLFRMVAYIFVNGARVYVHKCVRVCAGECVSE